MNKKKTESKTAKSGANKKKSPSVKELNETINNEKDKYVRLFAEFENYKRRTAKERIDLFKTAGKEVLSSLIPVCLLYTSPSPRDISGSRMPSSA